MCLASTATPVSGSTSTPTQDNKNVLDFLSMDHGFHLRILIPHFLVLRSSQKDFHAVAPGNPGN